MSRLFNASEYHTPADRRATLFQRLLPWSRIPFCFYVLREVLRGRREARSGHFGDAEYCDRSEAILGGVEKCGTKIHVEGLEAHRHLAPPAVFVANHMSLLETFLLPAMIIPFSPVSFVLKESLTRSFFLGDILRTQQSIAVGRTNPREDLRAVLEGGTACLQSGRSVCVFPQSTRMVEFSRAKFNSIGVRLAGRAGVPVVPIALKTDFVGNGKWLKDFGPVHRDRDVQVAFGPPILDTSNTKATQQTVVDFITARLESWGVTCTD